MPRKSRKSHGFGKREMQRKRRAKLAGKVSKWLLEAIVHDEVEASGALFPRKIDLRRQRNRKFLCLRQLSGRVYTRMFCSQVVQQMVIGLPFALVKDPKVSMEEHLQVQALRLPAFARKCKRLVSPASAATMDNIETQPMEETLAYEPWNQLYLYKYCICFH